MPRIKVTLWGKYVYHVDVPDNPTIHDLVWNISLEVHRQEGRTKFTDKPRTYNYVMECLLRKTAFNFRFNTEKVTTDTRKELYNAATELSNKTKAEIVKCPNCCGCGYLVVPTTTNLCPDCEGKGYVIRKQMYRVGDTFNNILVIDIDSHDEQNLRVVKESYEQILNIKFRIIKTSGGYWLFGDNEYKNIDDWKFAHCQVLYPCLTREQYKGFVKGLLALDKSDEKDFVPATAEDIKKSGLYHGIGNFDVAFTFLSIKRERSTIRESKKFPTDKIELIR